jgi:hypothetical protein
MSLPDHRTRYNVADYLQGSIGFSLEPSVFTPTDGASNAPQVPFTNFPVITIHRVPGTWVLAKLWNTLQEPPGTTSQEKKMAFFTFAINEYIIVEDNTNYEASDFLRGVELNLRPIISRPVRLGYRPSVGTYDEFIYSLV